MNPDTIAKLKIDPASKQRSRKLVGLIFLVLALLTAISVYFARPWAKEGQRVFRGKKPQPVAASTADGGKAASTYADASGSRPAASRAAGSSAANSVLTASGYIVNRERIELSPRFMGLVKWIGVRKGDAVTNGQVIVLLDDAEYRVRLAQDDARLATARVAVDKAKVAFDRIKSLGAANIESQQAQDDARLTLRAAEAGVAEVQARIQEDQLYIDWTIIRSPINGVVLEKLVDANELVTPQTFGGTRGPSASLLALADLSDLQVEVDLNEADLAKVSLQQPCRVSPEAYSDKSYAGVVAEIAPEANRQKGTLQIKVQILQPDKYLTPELTARVDFLSGPAAAAR